MTLSPAVEARVRLRLVIAGAWATCATPAFAGEVAANLAGLARWAGRHLTPRGRAWRCLCNLSWPILGRARGPRWAHARRILRAGDEDVRVRLDELRDLDQDFRASLDIVRPHGPMTVLQQGCHEFMLEDWHVLVGGAPLRSSVDELDGGADSTAGIDLRAQPNGCLPRSIVEDKSF